MAILCYFAVNSIVGWTQLPTPWFQGVTNRLLLTLTSPGEDKQRAEGRLYFW